MAKPTGTVRFALNTEQSDRAFRRLQERAPFAIVRALNRAAKSATTLMIRKISADTGIKQKDLRGTTKRNRAIWSSEAVPGREICTVFASTERVPLMDFNAKGPRPSRGKGRGVSANLVGGARRYPEAFIATMQSGHTGVFSRQKKSAGAVSDRAVRRTLRARVGRLPVYELRGPSIYRVWAKHSAAAQARAMEQLEKNLRSEFRYVLGQTTAPPAPEGDSQS